MTTIGHENELLLWWRRWQPFYHKHDDPYIMTNILFLPWRRRQWSSYYDECTDEWFTIISYHWTLRHFSVWRFWSSCLRWCDENNDVTMILTSRAIIVASILRWMIILLPMSMNEDNHAHLLFRRQCRCFIWCHKIVMLIPYLIAMYLIMTGTLRSMRWVEEDDLMTRTRYDVTFS
jgi:hypothetical protein